MIYAVYPVWLIMQPCLQYDNTDVNYVDGISVIFLLQNGEKILADKIQCLQKEINDFEHSELIIIDDASKDSSVQMLKKINNNRVRIVLKEKPMGIPHSMNLGVSMALYQHIVFCDQRQWLRRGAIRSLVEPLKNQRVGAVSSCISDFDKTKKRSMLRSYENFLKRCEGRLGSLVGVYGPLYAVKKDCYKEMPGNIILDDLYMTLSILKEKKVLFCSECLIIDEEFDKLYNYKRTKRYLKGFIQILKEKKLLSGLTMKQIVMLFWHKYFRIVIPLLLISSYILLVVKSFVNRWCLLAFVCISVVCLLSLASVRTEIFRQIKSSVRCLVFYSIAPMELFFNYFISNKSKFRKK